MAATDHMRRWVTALALAWLTLTASAPAQAEQAASGLRLFGADRDSVMHAPRLGTTVDIRVTGMLARVSVVQRFSNPGAQWVEGIYVFPLPDDAAVDHLRMRYAGRLIEGEIRERQQAKREYQQARAEGRAATLLDQQRANVFTTSVANIPPGETIEIEIEYQQVADWRDATYALRFPGVVGPRYVPGVALGESQPGASGNGWAPDTDQVPDASRITPPVVAGAGDGFNPLTIRALLDVGLPLAVIDSPYHAIRSREVAPGRYRVELADGAVPAERDFELRWRPELRQQPSAALFSTEWQGDHYSLLTVMPPNHQVETAAVARELILVVDTSGSMHGDSIVQARAALDLALRQLRPGDRFNVVQFNSDVQRLFTRAVPASAANVRRARAYVDRLRAEGGTEMLPAMHAALDTGVKREAGLLRQVVFLTDGAIGNEAALFAAIVERIGDSRLFTVGIGSAPNALFMRKAARFGRGTFAYIGSTAEVGEKMQSLLRRLGTPVLTDLRLHWRTADGRPVTAQAPQRLPDLYADEPLVVAVQAPSAMRSVEISGRFGSEPWTHRVALHGGAASDAVHVLWARRTIDDLLAGQLLGADAASVRDAVVELALRHHLVTRYTSLVAVEQEPIRPPAEGLRSTAVPTRLPAGWSASAVFGQLPGTATPALLYLLLGLLACAAGLVLRRR